jgi:aerobic carbon-monoxide dehydrogenase large subunit
MKYVGKGVPMMTNRRLAMGRGTFTADVKLPKLCWLAVLRSPYAHARLV